MDKSYGIFCIASQLLNQDSDLDVVWEKATNLYIDFLSSKFNDVNKSELDCINNFLTKVN